MQAQQGTPENYFFCSSSKEVPTEVCPDLFFKALVSDHLGNVRATFSDKRLAFVNSLQNEDPITDFNLDVTSWTDYYAFGAIMPGRNATTPNYRYGFNGKEKDDEMKSSSGTFYDYGFRIYDPRLAKFLSEDPLSPDYPWYTPYQFAGNNPIRFIDLDGLEEATDESFYGLIWVAAIDNTQSGNHIQATIERHNFLHNYRPPVNQGTIRVKNPYEGTPLKASSEMFAYNYEHVGQYTPGLGDIGDAANIVDDVYQGNFIEAGLGFFWFFPGSDYFKPLKSLKGANVLGGSACMDYAKDFIAKHKEGLASLGADVKRFEIKMDANAVIGTTTEQLSNTGVHQYVEVILDGKTLIFDNLHPEGILKDDYLKEIAGASAKDGFLEGAELLNKFTKEVTQ